MPRPRRPRTSLIALCLLGAQSQPPVEIPTGVTFVKLGTCPVPWEVRDGSGPCHCYPKNVTSCCQQASLQAEQACFEYEQFGFQKNSCKDWPRAALFACERYCGDCNQIAFAVREICKFTLQVLGDGQVISQFCQKTHDQFLNYRCPGGCLFNETNCTSAQGNPEGDQCMIDCGNYATCNCRVRRGTLQPDVCDGPTVLSGPMSEPKALLTELNLKPDPYQNWTCANNNPPLKCRNHIAEGLKCSKYRLCPPNMCLIKRVTCPPLDQCTKPGFCDPAEGLCYYNNVDDGTPCNDGISYTVRDQCINGFCHGTVDYCLKYNVTCESLTECLTHGTCHPKTGRCSYEAKPNGYPCNDDRTYTVEDRCHGGYCQGRDVDLCVETGVDCQQKVPNDCHVKGACNPETGDCSAPIPLSNKTCDDEDDTTVNDTCIDGICIGYPETWQTQKFLTLGEGECADRNGRQTASYAGDVEDEKECEKVCREDRQCAAFSYSPPVCTAFGTIRTQPPPGRRWAWQLGSVPMAVILEEALVVEGSRESICRKKDWNGPGDVVLDQSKGKVEINVAFGATAMAILFSVSILVYGARPIYRCLRTMCCGPPRTVSETRVVVQSPEKASDGWGDSDDEQDLRLAAQAALADSPGSPQSPISPVSPQQLRLPDSPEPLSPSQALSPFTLSPTSPNDEVGSQRSGQRWQRPTERRRHREIAEDQKPPPPTSSIPSERTRAGPNIAPASMANGAQMGINFM